MNSKFFKMNLHGFRPRTYEAFNDMKAQRGVEALLLAGLAYSETEGWTQYASCFLKDTLFDTDLLSIRFDEFGITRMDQRWDETDHTWLCDQHDVGNDIQKAVLIKLFIDKVDIGYIQVSEGTYESLYSDRTGLIRISNIVLRYKPTEIRTMLKEFDAGYVICHKFVIEN